ncbi:hypothetical protein AXF42_Ash007386 [Apostasia shenzhenica]|uniref:Uncharacterized protein n=1 Tax=Apostasia shenzhenica TaxID=1088818 RepID=A0A2I0BA43_9ASPA|nr:hypothetical protein AXF42_Ash007386 [Apostasia shenzhenica]
MAAYSEGMGEEALKMLDENQPSFRAEDEEDIGDNSDSGDESDESCSAPSPRRLIQRSPSSNSPLHGLCSLVEQLPIKKGLSKHYQGKSQSFTSLSEVKFLEDLPKKKEISHTMKIKPCRRSYAGGLDEAQNVVSSYDTSNKSIGKRVPTSLASCASSIARTSSSGFLGRSSRPPPIPINKNQ